MNYEARTRPSSLVGCLILAGLIAGQASIVKAQDAQQLAKELANPVANLISVPFQSNWDRRIGPLEEGNRYTLNIQPVIPLSISQDWNLINRVILPVVDQSDVFPGAGSQFGLSDTTWSLLFSPKRPSASGWIWGAGPILLLPTGTDDLLASKKWGLGPTGVALRQEGSWTYGALANHIWSVAGSSDRLDVSRTFLQPFLNYTTKEAWSFVLVAEATYDWEADDSSIPVTMLVGKTLRLGGQTVQVAGGPRYYVSQFDNGPKGWGARLNITLLFPK